MKWSADWSESLRRNCLKPIRRHSILIVQGIEVAGDPDKHDGREKNVAVIDFDHPDMRWFT